MTSICSSPNDCPSLTVGSENEGVNRESRVCTREQGHHRCTFYHCSAHFWSWKEVGLVPWESKIEHPFSCSFQHPWYLKTKPRRSLKVIESLYHNAWLSIFLIIDDTALQYTTNFHNIPYFSLRLIIGMKYYIGWVITFRMDWEGVWGGAVEQS